MLLISGAGQGSAIKCYLCSSVTSIGGGCGSDDFKTDSATESGNNCKFCKVISVIAIHKLHLASKHDFMRSSPIRFC